MTDFFHGIRVGEVKRQTRSIATIATAVIGIVVTAPKADAAAFPLDVPVKITNIDDAIAKAGDTGTLLLCLRAIKGQVTAPIVVVRVAPGANAADTTTAIVGTDAGGVKTGMQALLSATAQLDLHPRIIGAPGLESETVTKALVAVGKKLRARVYAAALGADRGAAINDKLRSMTRAGQLLGGASEFLDAKNSVASLKVGQLVISYRYTPVPPLEGLGLDQEITDEFFADFTALVSAA